MTTSADPGSAKVAKQVAGQTPRALPKFPSLPLQNLHQQPTGHWGALRKYAEVLNSAHAALQQQQALEPDNLLADSCAPYSVEKLWFKLQVPAVSEQPLEHWKGTTKTLQIVGSQHVQRICDLVVDSGSHVDEEYDNEAAAKQRQTGTPEEVLEDKFMGFSKDQMKVFWSNPALPELHAADQQAVEDITGSTGEDVEAVEAPDDSKRDLYQSAFVHFLTTDEMRSYTTILKRWVSRGLDPHYHSATDITTFSNQLAAFLHGGKVDMRREECLSKFLRLDYDGLAVSPLGWLGTWWLPACWRPNVGYWVEQMYAAVRCTEPFVFRNTSHRFEPHFFSRSERIPALQDGAHWFQCSMLAMSTLR
ncbi:hypothetical protein WJX72_001665 [[Myrmecia] bisecta]|uniref:Uncharacterized protein n=1 Tax=[Myrmecia] bisecta TaxID=41462 RepID=A0AAW1P5Y5_9CHLO